MSLKKKYVSYIIYTDSITFLELCERVYILPYSVWASTRLIGLYDAVRLVY